MCIWVRVHMGGHGASRSQNAILSGRGSALYRTYTKMRGSPPRELRQASLINQFLVLFIFRSGHWKAPDSNERIVEMLRAKQSTTLACMF